MIVLKVLLLFTVGTIAGFLNVLAGGGSFLTLPMLIFMGLPPTVANGTNRVAIFMQNVIAVKRFHDYKVFPFRFAIYVMLPAVLGSILGAYCATIIADDLFKKILAFLMVGITLLSMSDPTRGLEKKHMNMTTLRWMIISLVFLAIGFYGGFVQAGVGFLILSAMVFTGFDFVEANAVKVFVILIFTVFALVVFTLQHKVNYVWGIILGCGNVLGAYIATAMAIKKGNKFVQKVVLVAIIIMALKLLFG